MAIFCGSALGVNSSFSQQAQLVVRQLVKHDFDLVYGGASVGIMGVIADEFLRLKREVVGIIPEFLSNLELSHLGLTNLLVVESMHERKQKMYDHSHAFMALPGGMGTLDELCEIITWAQLSHHHKPIYIYNDRGYYDHFVLHIQAMAENGFLKREHLNLIKVCNGLDELSRFLVQDFRS